MTNRSEIIVPPNGENAETMKYTPEQLKIAEDYQKDSESILKKYAVQNAGRIKNIESIPESDQVKIEFESLDAIARNRDDLLSNIKGLAESLKKYGSIDGQDTVQHTVWMLNKGLKACIKNGRERGCHISPSDPHADVYRKGYVSWFEDQLRKAERNWRGRA